MLEVRSVVVVVVVTVDKQTAYRTTGIVDVTLSVRSSSRSLETTGAVPSFDDGLHFAVYANHQRENDSQRKHHSQAQQTTAAADRRTRGMPLELSVRLTY